MSCDVDVDTIADDDGSGGDGVSGGGLCTTFEHITVFNVLNVQTP